MVALSARASELTRTPLPHVGLWVEDPRLCARCRLALREFDIDEVTSTVELQARAAALDLLIAVWRADLADVALRLGLRLIVVGDHLPEPLVDALGRGLQASLVATPDLLADEVRRFCRALRAPDHKRHRVPDARVRFGGAATPLPIGDLSNDGLSFLVEDAPIDDLLPGAELGAVEILRGPVTCVDGVVARVRHVEPLGPGRYRIGCALEPAPPAAPPRVTVLRDRALCAALIKSGARAGIVLEPLERDEGTPLDLQLTGVRVDLTAGTVSADGDAALPEMALVRGRFELAGRLYRFPSVVLAREPLTIKLPRTIEELQQRSAARWRPGADEPLAVEVTSSLTGAAARKPLVDLSSSGVSFFIDGTRELFPIGLRVSVTIELPDGPVRADGAVRTLVREAGQLRCGVELAPLEEAAHARLCDLIMRRRFPAVGDGTGVPFDALADFFRATGFLYPEKEAVIAPIFSDVRRTFEALYGRPSRLFKAVVARDGEAVVGHVAVIRVYRHTWMSHHLAARSSHHVAHLLNMGAADYFGLNPDLEYCKIFFQPDLRWPSRVFGGFARTLRDSTQSVLREFRHVTLPTAQPIAPLPEGIEVIEASDPELAVVERHLVEREPTLLLRADDLLRPALTLAPVNKQYGRLGLFRRRRVLLALQRNVPVGFALAEISSPGLNLSEALSLFRVYVTPEGEADADRVRRALLHVLATLYRQAGRPFMGGLVPVAEEAAFARIGVMPDDTWLCWTCHRGLYARFCDYVDRLFEVLRRRKRG